MLSRYFYHGLNGHLCPKYFQKGPRNFGFVFFLWKPLLRGCRSGPPPPHPVWSGHPVRSGPIPRVHQNKDSSMIEFLNVWILNVWKYRLGMFEFLNVWMFENMFKDWMFECLKCLNLSMFEMFQCFNVWMFECFNVWMFEQTLQTFKLPSIYGTLKHLKNSNIQTFKDSKIEIYTFCCLNDFSNLWVFHFLKVSMFQCKKVSRFHTFECLKVWMFE